MHINRLIQASKQTLTVIKSLENNLQRAESEIVHQNGVVLIQQIFGT